MDLVKESINRTWNYYLDNLYRCIFYLLGFIYLFAGGSGGGGKAGETFRKTPRAAPGKSFRPEHFS